MNLSKHRYVGALLLAMPLLVMCANPTEVSTTQVRTGTLRVSVSGSGTIEPRQSAELSVGIAGTVESVEVEEGQTVREGDLLLSLDPRDAQQSVTEAEASLAAAQARAEQARNGNATDQDIKAAQASVDEQRARLEEAQAGGVTPEDITAADAAVRSAEADLERARTGNITQADIANAEAAVRSAEADLERARTGNITQADIDNAAAALRSAEADLERARTGNITQADIANAEAAVRVAEANLERVRTGNVTQADIDNAQAALRSAEANLEAVKADPPPSEVSAAQQRLREAQEQLSRTVSAASANKTNAQQAVEQSADSVRLAQEAYSVAYWDQQMSLSGTDAKTGVPYSRLEKLFGAGYVEERKRQYEEALKAAELALQQAESQLEQAKVTFEDAKQKEINDIAIAQSVVDDAQVQLDEVLKGPKETDVAQAQAQVDQARAALDKLLAGGTPADIAAAQAQVDQARAELQKLQQGGTPADIASAQAKVDQARANLAKLQGGGTPADIAAAQAQVDQARAELQKLQQGGTPADIAAAQAQVDEARASLAELQQGGSPADIAAAEALVEQSEAAFEELTAGATTSDLDIAQANVREAEARLERAKLNLDRTTLRAPFDGVVTAIAVGPGDSITLSATTPVVTVVDPAQLHVDVSISEADVAQIHVGQAAMVNVDALGIDPIRGIISYIAPVATVVQNVTTYPARIDLPQNIRSVLAGMNVSVEVGVAEKNNILIVPSGAIRTTDGRHFVLLKQGDSFVDREVQIGLSNDIETEITRGLSENDVIASIATLPDLPVTP